MKIAIFDPYLDTMSGGEKYMLTAAISLAKTHDVTILWDTSQKQEIIDKALRRFGFDLKKFSFKDPLFSRKVSLPSRLLKSREYDVIFLLSDGSIPIVSCDLVLHFQSPMEWVDMGSFISRVKLSRVKRYICNSMFTKEYIDKRFHIVSDVIYPPVFIQEKYDEDKKENIILNVGRFGITGMGSSMKKQDVLAEAFAGISDKAIKDWKMVFVMSVMDKEMTESDAFIKKYQSENIHFVVNPTNSELWLWYKKARLYWHASGYGEDISKYPDKAEHFGITTVEAMGVGAVPIVINAGGQKEIVQQGENGFLWDSKEQLVKYTLELIKDKSKRKALAMKGIESATGYSADEFELKIQEMFS